jgi:hypothetical protein
MKNKINYKMICLIFIILILISQIKNVEGLFERNFYSSSCCGGLSPLEFNKSSNSPPFKIHRCMKNYDYYKPCPQKGNRKIWTDKDKTGVSGWKKDETRDRWYREEASCCNGFDTCIPSTTGGKCRMRSGRGYYIFNKKGDKEPIDDDSVERDYIEYRQPSSGNSLVFLNYFILLIISLFIIYYFHKIFVQSELSSKYEYEYGYMGDIQ